jgi:hypothetical protein
MVADLKYRVDRYWQEIERRPVEVQLREKAFPSLAARFAGRRPPHFQREDLEFIMFWKHTDVRWRNRALSGLSHVSDARIRERTARISSTVDEVVSIGVET